MPTDQEWLSLSQAAQLLGIHPTTLRRWADNGSVPAKVTPGGHRRFLRAELQVFLAQSQPSGPGCAGRIWGDYALVETRQRLTRQRGRRGWRV
jgi:excisionase family DNA binding protein